MDLVTLNSFAKINLGLELLSKREDGFHDIATVFQLIDLHDRINYRKTSGNIKVSSTMADIPQDESNLAVRAFLLFKEKTGISDGINIHIEKVIPAGGGLGGGSSNAATTLLAANYMWQKNLKQNELQKMAGRLGSDVSFFIGGGTALGTGKGDVLEKIELPADYWILLVCPGIHVSTQWVYKRAKITLTKQEKLTKFRSIFEHYDPHALHGSLVNELESVVFGRHPVLSVYKEQLYERDAFYAGMSGSGSTIYGLFSDRNHAEKAGTFFSIERGIRTFLCRPILSSLLEQGVHIAPFVLQKQDNFEGE